MKRTLIVAIALSFLASWQPLPACTTFCFVDPGQVIFGKNYDWNVDDGHLILNKRGVSRAAHFTNPGGTPARWTSLQGSVTFNQYGRDFPSGGMNEAGLVVELMWLDGTVYPEADSRPELGVLEWIQYQLDMSATVGDVLDSDKVIRIAGRTPLHYLVADRTGQVATIEFLNGRMKTRTGPSLPVAVLTNHAYDESLAFLTRTRREGNRAPQGAESLHRFARTAEVVAAYRGKPADQAVSEAFATLQSAGNSTTQWSIVYDAVNLRLYFRTRRQPTIRTLELRPLDFGCASPVMMIDMNAPGPYDISRGLSHWSVEANIGLVRTAYSKTSFLAGLPETDIQAVGRAPMASTCARGSRGSGAP